MCETAWSALPTMCCEKSNSEINVFSKAENTSVMSSLRTIIAIPKPTAAKIFIIYKNYEGFTPLDRQRGIASKVQSLSLVSGGAKRPKAQGIVLKHFRIKNF